jgi:uncharacterized protein YdeI (YjbR/CyaY-like superfamily)
MRPGAMPVVAGEGRFIARSRGTWRAWLTRHHVSDRCVWLILLKRHVEKPCVTLAEAVEEALCFGWIDGKLRRIDDERHALRFTPRRPGSVWSETNKARVRRLIAEGRMTEAGLLAVAAGKKSGQWQKARALARTTALPKDLALALESNPAARSFFAGLAPSYRKLYVAWVEDAKRPQTRQRRVATVLARAARGRKPGIDM